MSPVAVYNSVTEGTSLLWVPLCLCYRCGCINQASVQ